MNASGESVDGQGLDISASGRFVLFSASVPEGSSFDPNAPADLGNDNGLFRKDMDTGEIVRVDVLSDGSYVTPKFVCWIRDDVRGWQCGGLCT